MTRELAMVHAREGIRINSICPYASVFIFITIQTLIIFSGPLKTRKPAS